MYEGLAVYYLILEERRYTNLFKLSWNQSSEPNNETLQGSNWERTKKKKCLRQKTHLVLLWESQPTMKVFFPLRSLMEGYEEKRRFNHSFRWLSNKTKTRKFWIHSSSSKEKHQKEERRGKKPSMRSRRMEMSCVWIFADFSMHQASHSMLWRILYFRKW